MSLESHGSNSSGREKTKDNNSCYITCIHAASVEYGRLMRTQAMDSVDLEPGSSVMAYILACVYSWAWEDAPNEHENNVSFS